MSRKEVLSLYREILRLSKNWTAVTCNVSDTSEEKKYIFEEGQRLFRKNKSLATEKDITLAIQEGRARLELAIHYRNPYPRPVNFPPMSVAQPGKRPGKVQERKRRQAKPLYIRSYDEYDQN